MKILRKRKAVGLNICGVQLNISSLSSALKLRLFKPYQLFQDSTAAADISLTARIKKNHFILTAPVLFKDRQLDLTIRADRSNFFFESQPRLTVINHKFSRGIIYLDANAPQVFKNYPLQHPLDKLLLSKFLALHSGGLFHACGLNFFRFGLVFAGSSGAGKSTVAQLAAKFNAKNIKVLNDDRVGIRKINHEFFLFGTPWHGDACLYANQKSRLKAIYFLNKSSQNKLSRLSGIAAVKRLLSCYFFPLRKKTDLADALDFCLSLSEAIPCYEFSFVKDFTAFRFIQKQLGL